MKSSLTNSDSSRKRAPVATENAATHQPGSQVNNCAGTAGNESAYDKLTWEEKRELMYERREARGVIANDVAALRVVVCEFWTADRDFNRFPRLKVRNPLIG